QTFGPSRHRSFANMRSSSTSKRRWNAGALRSLQPKQSAARQTTGFHPEQRSYLAGSPVNEITFEPPKVTKGNTLVDRALADSAPLFVTDRRRNILTQAPKPSGAKVVDEDASCPESWVKTVSPLPKWSM